jgi:hypothetical protein
MKQLQTALFDDGLGHRVATFANEHGMRPLRAHEVVNLDQIGSEFTDEQIMCALDIARRLGITGSLTRTYLNSIEYSKENQTA